VMGSFLRYMDCSVVMVTGLRVAEVVAPMGEWELHRSCWRHGDDKEVSCGAVRHSRVDVLRVDVRARDMAGASAM
jgi:hypothetical protein